MDVVEGDLEVAVVMFSGVTHSGHAVIRYFAWAAWLAALGVPMSGGEFMSHPLLEWSADALLPDQQEVYK